MNIHDYMDRDYPGVTCVECGAEPAKEFGCGLALKPCADELAAETQRRPCVGMRADQTSHEWVGRYAPGLSFGPVIQHLEKRR